MKSTFATLLAGLLFSAGAAVAQDSAKPAGEAASQPEPPGLGEIMTLQQLRHINL